ncbi:MAG: hypothetical protein ACE5JF_10980, partial [Anaerolineales bacterium]
MLLAVLLLPACSRPNLILDELDTAYSPKPQSNSPHAPAAEDLQLRATTTQSFYPAAAPHPLSIGYLRDQEYPESEIRIVEILTPGSNYHRYVASYRSEGLKINALLTVPLGNEPESGWPVVVL